MKFCIDSKEDSTKERALTPEFNPFQYKNKYEKDTLDRYAGNLITLRKELS